MKKILIIILSVSLIFISGCATVYLSPDGLRLSNIHNIVAILPPSIVLKSTKGMSAETVKQQQDDEAKVFQQEIYSYMLQRKSKGQMVIDIQDVEETNVILKRNNLDILNMTTDEICQTLEVDGVLSSQFSLSKPMSGGAAVALLFLTGFGGATNEVTVSMSLKDCSQKSLIWKYDHKYSGGVLSSPASLVKTLMRDASKKMPYFKSTY